MSEWISVKDRLPEPSELVLVLDPGLRDRFSVERCSGRTGDWVHVNSITHWMPLPSPPVPQLTVKEALREAISQLDVVAGNLRSSRYCDWFQLEVDGITNITLPRLRAALESEE